jgi:hypothetical protein
MHFDQDFSGCRSRCLHIFQVENFRTAEFVYHGRFHVKFGGKAWGVTAEEL